MNNKVRSCSNLVTCADDACMHNAVDDQDLEVKENLGYEEKNQDSAPIAPPQPSASDYEVPVVQNPAYEHTAL